jgi:hypothetical protein
MLEVSACETAVQHLSMRLVGSLIPATDSSGQAAPRAIFHAIGYSNEQADGRYFRRALFGDGYVLGSPASRRNTAGRLASAASAIVLVPDYRLAPRASSKLLRTLST